MVLGLRALRSAAAAESRLPAAERGGDAGRRDDSARATRAGIDGGSGCRERRHRWLELFVTADEEAESLRALSAVGVDPRAADRALAPGASFGARSAVAGGAFVRVGDASPQRARSRSLPAVAGARSARTGARGDARRLQT